MIGSVGMAGLTQERSSQGASTVPYSEPLALSFSNLLQPRSACGLILQSLPGDKSKFFFLLLQKFHWIGHGVNSSRYYAQRISAYV
jgi:hypothetical protein